MNSPTTAVIKTVSDALETPVEELPPLSRVIDPDALNRLVSFTESSGPSGVTVAFEYTGLKIVVHSCGMVYVTPIDNEGQAAVDRTDLDT